MNEITMNDQNTPRKSAPRKLSMSALWLIATTVLCLAFAAVLAPQAYAQGRGENAESAQYTSLIRTVFDFIQRHHVEEVESRVLFEGAMSGMFNALEDPYSAFLPESEMNSLGDTTQGSFGGVGLYIAPKSSSPRADGRPNFLEVAAPMEGTPGWKASINSGDFIIQVDGEATDVLSSDEAVARLRGTPGTDVQLLIRRGDTFEFTVTLTREVIEVPTVRSAMIGTTGYLRLLTFTPHSLERSRDAINSFAEAGYQSLILDLRNNFGGRLDSAVGISNLFSEGELVVSTRSRTEATQAFYARARALVPQTIPIIVLINRGSASASEIVAGALKDWHRAFLVGERTFGKGSVQQVLPLSNGSGFKLTTARYFTPSNANIDLVGIPPDLEVRTPDFSNADTDVLSALINSGRIADYIKENPEPTSAQIDAFVTVLSRDFKLDTALLRRLVRNEKNRRTIVIYDMEDDVQLQEAVRIFTEGRFQALMENTKTLRTLQEETAQEESFTLAS